MPATIHFMPADTLLEDIEAAVNNWAARSEHQGQGYYVDQADIDALTRKLYTLLKDHQCQRTYVIHHKVEVHGRPE